MKNLKYFLGGIFLACSFMTSSAQEVPFRTTVYDMNYDGSRFYRIPALITVGDGVVVAVADRRGDKLGDLPNNISIVCRRSLDNGTTWSEPIYIVKGKGEGKGYGDPCVIYDRETKKLLCFYAGGPGLWASTNSTPNAVYMSESLDNGLTWSTPKNITNAVYSSKWYGAFAGSGNGLQLKDGRLMFVVAARLTHVWGGELTNYAVYSDDHGQTWHLSAPVYGPGDEAKVVELKNGDVMMSIRNPQKGYRKFSISKDRGETWSMPYLNKDLMDPACNGDIVKVQKSSNILLQSLPASESIRKNVTVYASFDNGTTWSRKKQISNGFSAYSTITVLPNGQIGMLVEEGKWDANLPGEDGFVIDFVRFDLDWLTGK